jgi:hypothetical protein
MFGKSPEIKKLSQRRKNIQAKKKGKKVRNPNIIVLEGW